MNVKVKGTVITAFPKPQYKDKTTGELKPIQHAVQLMVDKTLNNGAVTKEMVDINIREDEIKHFESLIGKEIDIVAKLYSSSSISLTKV
ncbi:hypothetical protein ACMC56_09860 [Campylobacterota bacterium DY0563]